MYISEDFREIVEKSTVENFVKYVLNFIRTECNQYTDVDIRFVVESYSEKYINIWNECINEMDKGTEFKSLIDNEMKHFFAKL